VWRTARFSAARGLATLGPASTPQAAASGWPADDAALQHVGAVAIRALRSTPRHRHACAAPRQPADAVLVAADA